jgi:hypothetical protein
MNGAFRFVKLNAVQFELEFAEFENSANIRLEIVDDILMLHSQHLAGKSDVQMRHEFDIHSVIAGDVVDAIVNCCPDANSCLKLPKQQATGSLLASMILALGKIRWMRPKCRKLFGNLSIKKGLSHPADERVGEIFFRRSV